MTFKVTSLREVCDRAEAHAYTIVGYDDSNDHWKEAFLHPKEALGIVVQFAESHPELSESWGSAPDPVPAADEAPFVDVVGPRMSARSEERARTQWEKIAQGTCTPIDGALVFTWPDSPMRITGDIDPDAPEGPCFIELSSDRALGLLADPYPTLGTRFVQVGR